MNTSLRIEKPGALTGLKEDTTVFSVVWRRTVYLVLTLLTIASPFLSTWCALHFTLGGSLFDPLPVWNDELVYWHGILTFRDVGFKGGYYVFDELISKAAFSHFDPHGPAFFALFGILAALGPWVPGTAVLLNLLCLSGAAGVFLLLVRPSARIVALLGATLFFFSGIPLYTPIAMQESFHQGVAILLAALIYRVFKSKGEGWQGWMAAAIAVVVIASLIRVTWAFVLFPLVLLAPSSKTNLNPARHWVTFTCKGLSVLAAVGALFGVLAWWASPYPGSFNGELFALLPTDPLHALGILLDHTLVGILRLGQGTLVETTVRQSVVFLTIILGVKALYEARNWFLPHLLRFTPYGRECHFHLLNLALPLLCILALYDVFDMRDYRVLAPHLLLSLCLLLAYNRSALAALLLVWQISTYPATLALFQAFHTQRFQQSRSEVNFFRSQIGLALKYNPTTSSPWCNTVLTHAVSGYQFPPTVAALPAGIGFSVVLDWNRIDRIKSHYLLLDESNAEIARGKGQLELITHLGRQSLYRNNVEHCGVHTGLGITGEGG